MYGHNDVTWYRDGDPASEAIAAAAKIDAAAAEDLRAVLEMNKSMTPDDYYARGDEENEFSEEAQYEATDTDATELYRMWEQFKTSLRTETRLFNSFAQATLDSIFKGLDGTRDARGPVHHRRCRARTFQSLSNLEEALKRPDPHDPDEFGFLPGPITDDERRLQSETRPPYLSVDTDSIHVYEIKRAAYISKKFKVARHRSQMKGIKRGR